MDRDIITIRSDSSVLRDDDRSNIQSKICAMVKKTIDDKYEKEEDKFAKIVTNTVEKIVDKFQKKMLLIINERFEDKLTKFYTDVNSETSVNLIDKIIFDLGLNFNDALAEKRDAPNITSYAEYIKFINDQDDIKKKEAKGGRKTNKKRNTKRNKKRNKKRNTKRNTKRNKL
jgi:hypothetical protein